jgi:hypothetical protein
MQVGKHRDPQPLEGRDIERHRIFPHGQAGGHRPESGNGKQEKGGRREREKNASQNLIFARESTETALAPVWPWTFIW